MLYLSQPEVFLDLSTGGKVANTSVLVCTPVLKITELCWTKSRSGICGNELLLPCVGGLLDTEVGHNLLSLGGWSELLIGELMFPGNVNQFSF